MASPIEISQQKLLLVEGEDERNFFTAFCNAAAIQDIQIESYGGISKLEPFLRALPMLSGFERVKTIVIERDAETNPERAVQHVQKTLKKANLPVPKVPFSFMKTAPKTAFLIAPGFAENAAGQGKLIAGTLEDLCLEIVKDDSALECVTQYLDCVKSRGKNIKRPHKTKLHTYLSGIDSFVGLKIGEAAKAGAWNWEHVRLKPFIAVIKAM